MDIEIHTHERLLESRLFDSNRFEAGKTTMSPAEGITLIYNGGIICKSIGIPEIINLGVFFASEVCIGVFSNWLYDKLKNKKIEKLIINRTEVEVDRDKITKIIQENYRFQ